MQFKLLTNFNKMSSSNSEITSRRSSILKPPKVRQPLQNVDLPLSSTENSPITSTIKFRRRVSFAEKKHVKEFCDSVEQGTVWDNTYEESELSQIIKNSQNSNSDELTAQDNRENNPSINNIEIPKNDLSIDKIDDLENNSMINGVDDQSRCPDDSKIDDERESVRKKCLAASAYPLGFPCNFKDDNRQLQLRRTLEIGKECVDTEKKTGKTCGTMIFKDDCIEYKDTVSSIPLLEKISLPKENSGENFDIAGNCEDTNLLAEKAITTIFHDESMELTRAVSRDCESRNLLTSEGRTMVFHDDCMELTRAVPINSEFKNLLTSQGKTMVFHDDCMELTRAIPLNSELRNLLAPEGKTMVFHDDCMELTRAVPINCESRNLLTSEGKTMVFHDDSMELTRAVPINCESGNLLTSEGKTMVFHDDSMELTRAVPINCESRNLLSSEGKTMVFHDDCMELTRAVPINCESRNLLTSEGKTMVFHDDSMELTRPVSINCESGNLLTSEGNPMVFHDDSMELTRAIPLNRESRNLLTSEGKTMVFHDDSMELTRAVPMNIESRILLAPEAKSMVPHDNSMEFTCAVSVNRETRNLLAPEAKATVPHDNSMEFTCALPINCQSANISATETKSAVSHDDSMELTHAIPINRRSTNLLALGAKTMVFHDDCMERTRPVQFPSTNNYKNSIHDSQNAKRRFNATSENDKENKNIYIQDHSMVITTTVQQSSLHMNEKTIPDKENISSMKNYFPSKRQILLEESKIVSTQKEVTKITKYPKYLSPKNDKENCIYPEVSIPKRSTDHSEYSDVSGVIPFFKTENRNAKTLMLETSKNDSEIATLGSDEMELTVVASESTHDVVPNLEENEKIASNFIPKENDTFNSTYRNLQVEDLAGRFLLPNEPEVDKIVSPAEKLVSERNEPRSMIEYGSNSTIVEKDKTELDSLDLRMFDRLRTCGEIENSETFKKNCQIFDKSRIETGNENTMKNHSSSVMNSGTYDKSLEILRSRACPLNNFQPEDQGFELTEKIIKPRCENAKNSSIISELQATQTQTLLASGETINAYSANFMIGSESLELEDLPLKEALPEISTCMISGVFKNVQPEEDVDFKNAEEQINVDLSRKEKGEEFPEGMEMIDETYDEIPTNNKMVECFSSKSNKENFVDSKESFTKNGAESIMTSDIFSKFLTTTSGNFSLEKESFPMEDPDVLQSMELPEEYEKIIYDENHSREQLIFQDNNTSATINNFFPNDLPSSTIINGESINESVTVETFKNHDDETTNDPEIEKSAFCIFKENIEILSKSPDTIWTINRLDEEIVAFNFFSKSIILVIYLNKIEDDNSTDSIKDIVLMSQLIEEKTDPGINLAHNLIMKKLDVASFAEKYRNYEDVPELLKFISTEVRLGMDFLFELDHLRNHNVIEIKDNWLSFLARTQNINEGIILNVTMQMKPFEEMNCNDITVFSLLGNEKIRTTDIERMIVNIKRNHQFLRFFINDVKSYIDLMAETCISSSSR